MLESKLGNLPLKFIVGRALRRFRRGGTIKRFLLMVLKLISGRQAKGVIAHDKEFWTPDRQRRKSLLRVEKLFCHFL